MKIFINPGHDLKYDSGAVNSTHSKTEAQFADDIGRRVAQYLINAGYTVSVFQSDNLYYDSQYEDRQEPVCVVANDWQADVFVSIHCNAANGQARGTECLVYDGNNDRLASCIERQIVDNLGTVDRGIKYRPDLIVLKHTNMPAVLVETAFIDNDEDYELLDSRTDDFAAAIARGITDYFA